MWKRVLFLLLIVTLCQCDSNENEDRVVNGTPAANNEFPFMVSIRTRENTHDCGGSIIDTNTILTAGHCVCGYQDPLPTIQYGVDEISEHGPTIIRMKKIICHEDYIVYGDSYAHNDIALIKLAEPIEFGDNAKPILLPPPNQEVTPGAPALLLGWGLNETEGVVQVKLQKVDIEVISRTFCQDAYPGKIIVSNVCAGLKEGGKGQCNGDSGGPLLVNGHQIGIVSWSDKPCASPSLPGVFTKVAYFIDWIHKNK